MKEIYLAIATDSDGDYVTDNGKKYLVNLGNSDISPITQQVCGQKVIKCLSLVNGRRLALPIPD